LALAVLLPATMANKGGCSQDVDMGSDEEAVGGAVGSTDPKTAGGATAASSAPDVTGGALSTNQVPNGGKGGVDTGSAPDGKGGFDPDAKGGASSTGPVPNGGKGGVDTGSAPDGKGGFDPDAKGGAASTAAAPIGGTAAEPYLKCTRKDYCGEQPKVEPCANGSSPSMECIGLPSGDCAWKISSCGPEASCSAEACGKQPAFAPCEGDLPGAPICQPDAVGVCKWQQRCPDIPMCFPKCGPEPTNRGTCADGSLKALYCRFDDPTLKYVPCSELATTKQGWVETDCPVSVNCDGVDDVIVLPGYLAKSINGSSFPNDPVAIQALCKEAFRQPALAGSDFSCVASQQGYGYQLMFIDHDAADGALALKALVFPKGECTQLTTTDAAATTIRMPTQGLWEALEKVLGFRLQDL
jgi:hypothetical protein